MRSNVVSIDKGPPNQTALEPTLQYGQGADLPSVSRVYVKVSNDPGLERAGTFLHPAELYTEMDGDSRLLRALNIIERAKLNLQGALQYEPNEEFFHFDQEIMKGRALLANAFRYRDIGQGYAALVNAINWALANRKSPGPTKRQINVISGALDRLIKGPFMHFDTAMLIMDELEEADLDLEPSSLGILTSELDD